MLELLDIFYLYLDNKKRISKFKRFFFSYIEMISDVKEKKLFTS